MRVIFPLVAKSTSTCLAGSRFPEPETTVWITPRVTSTVRSETVAAGALCRLSTATATAAAASTTSVPVITPGRGAPRRRRGRGGLRLGGADWMGRRRFRVGIGGGKVGAPIEDSPKSYHSAGV